MDVAEDAKSTWSCQRALIANADVIFDVGACVGRTVSRYLEWFPEAIIYAFEPAPSNVKEFKRRLSRMDGSERVQIFEYAILDHDGETPLNLYGNHDHHSILKHSDDFAGRRYKPDWARKSIQVSTITLDTFCAQEGIEEVDILKVDAEGAEPRILKGAHRLLAEQRICLIFMEVIFFPFFEGQVWAWDLIPRLLDYDYKFHSLWHSGGRRINGANAIFLRQMPIHHENTSQI